MANKFDFGFNHATEQAILNRIAMYLDWAPGVINEPNAIAVANPDGTKVGSGLLIIDEMESATGWTAVGDASNLATSTTHLVGTKSMSWDKAGGTNVISGIQKTLTPAVDLGTAGATQHRVFWFLNFGAVANVATAWIRLGTDASNYDQWSIPVASLVANWNVILTPLLADPSWTQVGTGLNTSAVTYIAVGYTTALAADVLAGTKADCVSTKQFVDSMVLDPTGAGLALEATALLSEAHLGSIDTTVATLATEATVATLATEATVATLATEATVSTLATEATVSTLGTEATLALVATEATTAKEATLALVATEATVATLATEATAATLGTEATLALVATEATTAKEATLALVATEATAATLATEATTAKEATLALVATEATLATLATEATVATLATEATVATLGTEATLALVATEATTAKEATLALVATEATVATLATEATTAKEATLALVATEATLATLATEATTAKEATLALVATEATVATLGTEATLALVATEVTASQISSDVADVSSNTATCASPVCDHDQTHVSAATQIGAWYQAALTSVTTDGDFSHLKTDIKGRLHITADQLTDASQKTQIVDGAGNVVGAATGNALDVRIKSDAASLATSTKQSDGTQKTQVVDGSGNVIAAHSNAIDVSIRSDAASLATSTKQSDGTQKSQVVDASGNAVTTRDTGGTTRSLEVTGRADIDTIDTYRYAKSASAIAENTVARATPGANKRIAVIGIFAAAWAAQEFVIEDEDDNVYRQFELATDGVMRETGSADSPLFVIPANKALHVNSVNAVNHSLFITSIVLDA